MKRLTDHFMLEEFTKGGLIVPDALAENNARNLCAVILQPMRDALGWPVIITSGIRPAEYNERVGGVKHSDHPLGLAADFQVRPSKDSPPWEDATMIAWKWIAKECAGLFGQLIWEDHRTYERARGTKTWEQKLWVHVALVSARHPGLPESKNRLLFSYRPRQYYSTTEDLFA